MNDAIERVVRDFLEKEINDALTKARNSVMAKADTLAYMIRDVIRDNSRMSVLEDDGSGFVCMTDAANMLGVPIKVLRRMEYDRCITGIKNGGRVLFRVSDAEKARKFVSAYTTLRRIEKQNRNSNKH